LRMRGRAGKDRDDRSRDVGLTHVHDDSSGRDRSPSAAFEMNTSGGSDFFPGFSLTACLSQISGR
ncbi:MAG TPA: hypothetical protein VJQ52_19840, partial [Steroidobacteraceae bacterium]|nr:hypothetical protein [Steroidobacteraceae bacterium]